MNLRYIDGQKNISLAKLDEFMDWLIDDAGGRVDIKKAYSSVPWIFRGATLRAQAVASMPFSIYRGDNEVDSSENYTNALGFLPDPADSFGRIEGALCLLGKAYQFKTRGRARILDLRYLNPLTVDPDIDAARGLTGWTRNVNGMEKPLDLEDVVYFWQTDPYVELGPPKASAGTAALAAAGVLMNVDEFAAAFAARGMVKATILGVPSSTQPGEKERLEAWWSKIASGIRNAFTAKAFNLDAVKVTPIGEGFKELENVGLTDEKRKDISVAIGVPASILWSGDAGGLGGGGVVRQDDIRFYRDTVVPEGKLIAGVLNAQVFNPLGYRLEFKPETLDIFQQDENERSQAWRNYVGTGMGPGVPPSIAAQMLGLELPEGVEYADLDGEKKEEQPGIEQRLSQLEGQRRQDEFERDMSNWRSVALRELKAGRRPEARDFESGAIAPVVKAEIVARLTKAATDEEVKAAFAAPFRQGATWENYP